MLGTIFIVLGIALAVLWLIFVVRVFMVKVELSEHKIIFVTTCIMVIVGVYCSFIVVTNCAEVSQLESLKKLTAIQADRLHYLTTKLALVLGIGYASYIVQFVLSLNTRRNLKETIARNSGLNKKWNN